ncbi:Cyclic nucleotide-binding domain-containing protein 2 [Holothuria leucospilota]|uniref:Cyclic nucleotide-binding domain-containing protein 2 n=1 Tax=Holothuria leucospilota TaxID=206669 RepID=A0A9Q1BJF1_HOLLE|nr:Cyclic nucleotide-binding domain-containing protein 2 [Holothuria leucospilota]
MHLNLRADMEKNLAFDPITFSKLRVTRGSEKLKNILSLKPDKRTKEDIAVVLALLRNTKAFEDYQQETKHELARIMEYQKFEPRRIILKEGHVASCFYIILSGTCLVNKKEMDPRNGETFIRTIDEITSGQSFGEIGLLHDCPRTASVICKNEVEVLLINKEDFIRVVREPLERRREELVQFCRDNHLELNLQDEKVKDNPTAIYTQHYKAGTIICKDIYSSEYLYVVKSGRCNVIAEISKVREGAQNNSQNFSIHDDNWKSDAALKRTVHMLNQRESVHRGWSEHARDEFEKKEKNMTGTFIINGLQVTTPQLEAEAAAEKAKVLAIPETIFTEEEDPFPTTIPDQTDEELFDSKDGVVRTWKRITVATSMVGKKQRRKSHHYLLSGKAKKIYVQLAQLSEGALFGLESILNAQNVESGVNLSLRSEGGEVILVSKKFFASDANLSKALDAASKTTIEYPSAERTLQIIQQQRAWKNYKSDVLEQVYAKRREKSL